MSQGSVLRPSVSTPSFVLSQKATAHVPWSCSKSAGVAGTLMDGTGNDTRFPNGQFVEAILMMMMMMIGGRLESFETAIDVVKGMDC